MTEFPYQTTQLLVEQIAHQDMFTCSPDATADKVVALMAENRVGSVVVVEDDQPVGIVSRRDLMHLSLEERSLSDYQAYEFMSSPVRTVKCKESVEEVGLILLTEGFRHLVVVDDEEVLYGIISETDIVNSQGMEHDLFLRSVTDVADSSPLRIPATEKIKVAISSLRSTGRSAALVVTGDRVSGIVTENDVMSLMATGKLDDRLADHCSQKIISIRSDISLYNARKIFRQHAFHHLAVKDCHGEIFGLLSYSDILKNVELDYVYRLKELLSERDQALALSQHNLRLADKVIQSSMEAIVVTDKNANIERVNPAFTDITGYEAWEVIGKNPKILSSGRHDQTFYNAMWDSLQNNGVWQGEIWNKRKDGTLYPEWLSITAIEDDEGNICQYASIFSDLTEIKRSEARIKRLAYFDELTRLPNRKLFNDRLQQALGYAQEHNHKVGLAFVDIDYFQRVNDHFGHEVGDQVICEIARRIEAMLEEGDTVARFGGDEFNLILTDVDSNNAVSELLSRMLRAINQPILVQGIELKLTVSVGVTIYPNDAKQPEELFKCADAAVMQAKDFGRNSFRFFSSEQHQYIQSRFQMANDLHQAIETGQFELYYQPKVLMGSRSAIGAEALIRWKHPHLGYISPAEFIPLAEDLGLIDEIGHFVLCSAAQQVRSWLDLGLELQVAINVSAKQMQRRDIADEVIQVLQQHQLPAEAISIELTETSFLHCLEETKGAIAELRYTGVGVAIDDFGTGYSSLSYIREMPLDELKIDRSFLINIENSEVDRKIVSAIIEMSQAMGLRVVAEGVETEAQYTLLKELNCDLAQGYLLARPMPAAEFLHWYQQQAEE